MVFIRLASFDSPRTGIPLTRLIFTSVLAAVAANPHGSFIVATETGMMHPLRQLAPQANLIEANRMAVCKYMKMITLAKLRDSLREMQFEVSVPEELAVRARVPIERMVAIG